MRARFTAISLLMLYPCFGAPAERKAWLDVPYVLQSRDGCGAAAIAMVMQYWIRTNLHLEPAVANDARIYSQLATPGRRGIAGQKLKQYLEEHGYNAHVFSGEPQDLRDNLQKGRPLVVCLSPRGANALLHYVVVVGASDSSILYHDPARGKLIEQRMPAFLRQWKATGSWVLLATPQTAQ
jgi:predicted double-glycine peptidase